MSLAYVATGLATALAWAPLLGNAGTTTPRPFTVVDSIGLTELAEPRTLYNPYVPARFHPSPDQRWFSVVTRRGDMAKGDNEYRLLLFDAAKIREAINRGQPNAIADPLVLAIFRSSSSYRAIEQVRWIDNERVAFIGRRGNGEAQIYSADASTMAVDRLSAHEGGVIAYDYSSRTRVAIYSAVVPPDWTTRNQHGYVVGRTNIGNLATLDSGATLFQDVGYFMQRAGGETRRLDVPFTTTFRARGSLPVPRTIALSPDARWAVVLGGVKNPPEHWRVYEFVRNYRRVIEAQCSPGCAGLDDHAVLNSLTPEEPTAARSAWMQQYYLVDIATGEATALLDAPSGYAGHATHIAWAPDSRRIVVSPSFLPVATLDKNTQAGELSAQAAVVVDIPSRRIAKLTDQDVGSISHVAWSKGDVITEWTRSSDLPTLAQRFHEVRSVWTAFANDEGPDVKLQLDVVEGMNTSPDIQARDLNSGRHELITDLNPQLLQLTMGRVEVFRWEDRYRREYVGGVIVPPGAKQGARYPVVLQTDGFYPQEFLVDGPDGMSTAYAARALASSGMVVLQMPSLGKAQHKDTGQEWRYEVDGENPRFVAMMEGAIDALDRKGVIDRKRVGLIGFSREGMHALYAITFSRYPIAAATIAHSFQPTPFSYALAFGAPYPAGMHGVESQAVIGAPFWGDGVRTWIERSPAFHLDRVNTPLRIEHLATNVPEYWDTFAVLKHLRKPVEMVHIPLAAHQVERPFDRYTSQQGNVEWFAFWLNGDESLEPKKTAQYMRWRELRRLRDARASNPTHRVCDGSRQEQSSC